MGNHIKSEIEKIEIPINLHERSMLGVTMAKREMDQVRFSKKKFKKVTMVAAAVMIIGASLTFGGGTYLVNAGQTLISQIFGTKEEIKKLDPIATEVDLQRAESKLVQAKEILSAEDFEKYSVLLNEMGILVQKITFLEDGVKVQSLELLTKDEQQRLEEIQAEIAGYEQKISASTDLTMEEAKKVAAYPIEYPSYVPEGYDLKFTEAVTVGLGTPDQPIIRMDYAKGEFAFRLIYSPFIHEDDDEITRRSFQHKEEYVKNEYRLEYVYSDDTNVSGMRVTIPGNDSVIAYKVLIIADTLSKEEMEKILLSIIKK
jgi:hypothetical protein